MTGSTSEILGLYPAVYFSNDRGKSNRFLFLGMTTLISEKIRNNDDAWFRKFTLARRGVESFLIENRSVIGIVLQNLSKTQRIQKMIDMFNYLVLAISDGRRPDLTSIFSRLGLSGRIYDVTAEKTSARFDDDTKSQIFYRGAIKLAQTCPICMGYARLG